MNENLYHSIKPRIYEIVLAASYEPLNKYKLREGKIYGSPYDTKTRYKIIKIERNHVIYRDISEFKVHYVDVDELIKSWSLQNIVEITPIDNILALIKKHLTPFLGAILVTALITWLMKKLDK